jgi:sugar phosphate isomerase/epimerase
LVRRPDQLNKNADIHPPDWVPPFFKRIDHNELMYATLSPGAIGVTAPDLDATIQAANIGGFPAIEVDAREIARLSADRGTAYVHDKLAVAGLKAVAFGLTVDWRKPLDDSGSQLAELAEVAQACSAIGCTRTFTWITPVSNDREYADNRMFHVTQLAPVARVLADQGCSFGLEFIGPKTIRDTGRYVFIYEMGPMLELAKEVGPNVGLMLDCWHWHTSGGTVADIEAITAHDIIDVHVNDAPAGVPRDQLQDSIRSVPGATGVIDIGGFLNALKRIGYDGPLTPEPFASELAGLGSDEERLRVVGEGMRKIMALIE